MNKRVIVAEDDREQRAFLVSDLKEMGFNVVGFDDGWPALEDFKLNGADAIFTDGNMLQMDGPELLVEIRKLDASIPVFLRSACREDGFTDWLEKPCPLVRLKQVVQRYLA